jgi:ribosomal protein RSM22 (predicted rRNA methylase)
MVETDAPTLSQGQALAANRPAPADFKLRWLDQPALDAAIAAEPHDVVLLSYALEEAGGDQGAALIAAAWAKAKSGLLIVEPGTPAGFARILGAREQLLKSGGTLVAPCPQSGLCPQAGKIESAWCHFSVRLERRGLHRLVKGGDLGYEDEKYAFLYFSKAFSGQPAPYRLLSFPRRSNRHIELDVCSFEKKRVKLFLNRRETPANVRSAARKLNWGDAWDPEKVPPAEESETFDDGDADR